MSILKSTFIAMLAVCGLSTISTPAALAGGICREIFESGYTNEKLPKFASVFKENTTQKMQTYSSENSVLENKQYEIYGKTLEQQMAIVEKARAEAIEDLAQLLIVTPDLKGLSENQAIYIAERSIRWGSSLPVLNIAHYEAKLLVEGIDPFSRPKSIGNILKQYGFENLTHDTTLEAFIEMLKSGFLRFRASGGLKEAKGGVADFVYLEAMPPYLNVYTDSKRRLEMSKHNPGLFRRKYFSEKRVFLEFDSSVLDSSDLAHWSLDWEYGRFNPRDSMYPTYEIAAALHTFDMKNGMMGFQPRNEFLLRKAVPVLKYIKGINVHPEDIDRVKQTLREAGASEFVIALVK